ncbi:MAG: hypothetical protein ACOH2V_00360 [Candidatus Saccharimonadaceae bacterium]
MIEKLNTTVPSGAFANIVDSSLTCVSKETIKRHVSVEFAENFVLKVPHFSIIQFFEGFKLKELVMKEDGYSTLVLVQKIAKQLMPTSEDEPLAIDFTRKELLMLKTWLELRMLHCEGERDVRSTKFNPDSYISMKILLIDIRELLLGDIDY